MSEPQISETAGSPGEMVEDPLLGSDSFIDTEKPGTESPEHKSTGLGQGVAIAAEPISMLRPGEGSVEAAPKSTPRRRDPEEMSKRPTWLPEDWTIDLRVRSSGATAGLIDRYFLGPSGQPRLRSKNEVMSFLETGSSKKRKATSEADAEPSESLVTSPKRSSKKGKKGKKSDDVPKSPVTSQRKSSKKDKNVPKKSSKKAKNVPKKSDDVPAKSNDVPAKSDDAPTKSDDAPTKSDDAPAKSDDAPAKSDDVPEKFEDENAPAKSDDPPAKSDDPPAKSDDAPAKSDDVPEKFEDDDASAKSDDAPEKFEEEDGPEKFEDIPMEFEDAQEKSEDVGSEE